MYKNQHEFRNFEEYIVTLYQRVVRLFRISCFLHHDKFSI